MLDTCWQKTQECSLGFQIQSDLYSRETEVHCSSLLSSAKLLRVKKGMARIR